MSREFVLPLGLVAGHHQDQWAIQGGDRVDQALKVLVRAMSRHAEHDRRVAEGVALAQDGLRLGDDILSQARGQIGDVDA